VTSSRPEEGKSSTSYSLGVQLADIGLRVLLVDADMRRPSFTVSQQDNFGFSSLLTSESHLTAHIARTTTKNLFLLPSGPIPPNPSNIILPARLTSILEQARELFDHIIIDAPPVAGFADAILLGSCADGVLFTVESGKTRTALARAAIAQLRMAAVNLVGGTLTKASARAGDYGYGYSKYYSDAPRGNKSTIAIAAPGDASDQRFQS
jgi:capsular exopolysaccharide synthesis family protein